MRVLLFFHVIVLVQPHQERHPRSLITGQSKTGRQRGCDCEDVHWISSRPSTEVLALKVNE